MSLLKMILPKVKISGQPYKKDFAGYVTSTQCCEQEFFNRKKFREVSFESKKALVDCVAYD